MRNAIVSYYLPDGFGSVRALANAAGIITDRYDYDAFGRELTVFGTTINPFRYRGEATDAFSGLQEGLRRLF